MRRQMITSLVWYNLKLTVHYSWCLSAALLAVIPFFMDAGLMGQNEVARLGERLISFLGLIIYPHLALLENGGIGEPLYAKQVRHPPIFLFRWLLTTFYVFLVNAAFFTWLNWSGADFNLWPMTGGVPFTAVAIGTAGITAAPLICHRSAGFIPAFPLFLPAFRTKRRRPRPFYPFGPPQPLAAY
ncbi:hypothetical protein AMQ83_28575, partial [Paenibacillus riograndensis]